jgi:Holliday junction resolvasome RuvABC endonuclease subunit
MWLAIDPSFRNTGWCIMDEKQVYYTGLIETKAGSGHVYLDNQRCLGVIFEGLDYAIQMAVDMGADRIHSEAKGGSKSAKAGTMMAMAQAVVAAKAHEHKLPLLLILPGRAKEVGTGDRKASKNAVRAAMEDRYPELLPMIIEAGYTQKDRQEHIFDAALCGYAIVEYGRQGNK